MGPRNRPWKDFIDQNQNPLPLADVRGYQLVRQTSRAKRPSLVTRSSLSLEKVDVILIVLHQLLEQIAAHVVH